jgi:hypothetical protein
VGPFAESGKVRAQGVSRPMKSRSSQMMEGIA